MNNIETLYRQVIMDHYKNPRNRGLKGYKQVHLRNPSCGDDIYIEADIENGTVKKVCHDGSGCAICCSSASVMTELLSGKKVEEANKIVDTYLRMIKGEAIENEEILDEAFVFQGVSKFPARLKCATIAWKAMEELLGEKQ